MRIVSERLCARWYVGYDFHEPLPDHSSLTRIRDLASASVGVPRVFFERIVELCVEAGLVWGADTDARSYGEVSKLPDEKEHVPCPPYHHTSSSPSSNSFSLCCPPGRQTTTL
jgi:hypothetical protein